MTILPWSPTWRPAGSTILPAAKVKVYLLLLDTAKPRGLTASWIAEHLEMSANAVRSCLSVLKRKGYVQHNSLGSHADGGKPANEWICNPGHNRCDPEMLYYQFALLRQAQVQRSCQSYANRSPADRVRS